MIQRVLSKIFRNKFRVIQSGYLAKRALELDDEYKKNKEISECIKKVLDECQNELNNAEDNDDDISDIFIKYQLVCLDYISQSSKALSYAYARDELISLIDDYTFDLYGVTF